jgi:hypothetical protein
VAVDRDREVGEQVGAVVGLAERGGVEAGELLGDRGRSGIGKEALLAQNLAGRVARAG